MRTPEQLRQMAIRVRDDSRGPLTAMDASITTAVVLEELADLNEYVRAHLPLQG